MILHRNTFIDESNRPKLKEIQDSCASCLIKLFKFYKVIIFYKCQIFHEVILKIYS